MERQLPRTAPAAHLARYGSPAQVRTRDVAVPEPAARQVVVRVAAAGVNRGDGLAIEGLPYAARLSYGVTRPRSPVPGTDIAGHVVSVGPGVTTFTPGDAVVGWARGAFAAYAVAPADDLVPATGGISLREAAAAPTAAVTALQALRAGGTRPGHQVLVLGAAGGVGTFAVQLAKTQRTEVSGVCSTGNLPLVRSLGADHVIDRTTDDLHGLQGRFDVVLDLAGNRPLPSARHLAKPGGSYIVVGGGNPRSITGMRRFLTAVALSPFGPQRLRPLFAEPARADLETVVGLLRSGAVRACVEAAYDLRDAADAIDFVHRGRARGKVVLVP